eukprot:1371137-Rhodomonas_salina.1
MMLRAWALRPQLHSTVTRSNHPRWCSDMAGVHGFQWQGPGPQCQWSGPPSRSHLHHAPSPPPLSTSEPAAQASNPETLSPPTPRNQLQETAISVQFVPGMWCLVFDFTGERPRLSSADPRLSHPHTPHTQAARSLAAASSSLCSAVLRGVCLDLNPTPQPRPLSRMISRSEALVHLHLIMIDPARVQGGT